MKHPLLRKLLIYLIPPLFFLWMRLLFISCKKRYHHITPLPKGQHIGVLWHEMLLISPQIHRKLYPHFKANGIISKHFDGELIARTLRFIGIHPLRGSSSKAAASVLLEAFRAVKRGEVVLLTPDGPRGPRHKIDDGAIALAKRNDLPILIIHYKVNRAWRLKSWDRFIIPKPFSTLDIYLQQVDLRGLSLLRAKKVLQEKMLQFIDV